MHQQEKKYCPNCKEFFECKAYDITQCQCYIVPLSDEEKKYIEKRFSDCLCYKCLVKLKDEFIPIIH